MLLLRFMGGLGVDEMGGFECQLCSSSAATLPRSPLTHPTTHPAQIRAYCSSTSEELTTSPSEPELEAAGITRSEADLAKLTASYDIVSSEPPCLHAQRFTI